LPALGQFVFVADDLYGGLANLVFSTNCFMGIYRLAAGNIVIVVHNGL